MSDPRQPINPSASKSKSRTWADVAALALFAGACLVLAFSFGVVRGAAHKFPFSRFEAARKMWNSGVHYFNVKYSGDYLERAALPAASVHQHRVRVHEQAGEARGYLVVGGPQRFLEHCPDHGCLAVFMNRNGEVTKSVPYLPDEFQKGTLVDLHYEEMFLRLSLDVTPVSAVGVANGDLIVTFHFGESFPYGGGIARVNPLGKVVWYRRDYANHWAAVTGPDEVSVISGHVSREVLHTQMSPYHGFSVGCSEGYVRDSIEVVSLDGELRQEIPLFDNMWNSALRPYLMTSMESFSSDGTCDAMHANYARTVGPALAAKFAGVQPSDFLVSMRNLSSLGIVSRATGKFLHLIRGSFHYQHSAQPLEDGRILLVDNLGADPNVEGSRYLILDPATGQEQVLFPRSGTSHGLPTSTPAAGNIDVSKDGRRVLITATYSGRAFEVDLASGQLLTSFDNLHDLRPTGLGEANEQEAASRFRLWQVSFWPDSRASALP